MTEQGIARAIAVTEAFHGRPVNWIREVTEDYYFQDTHAILGRLLRLEVLIGDRLYPLLFSKGKTKVATTPDQTSLYVLGGDQRIDLAKLGLQPGAVKDTLYLGPLLRIDYHTTKDFHDFEPTDYFHYFGQIEEDSIELLETWQKQRLGEVPHLIYDTLNHTFQIAGGAYFVKREGIVH